VCVFLLLLAASVKAQDRRPLHGHVPAAAARAQPLGRLQNSTRLNLAIGLPLRNREALANLLKQIYDPTSPNYHRYLTSEQFTEMFGPTEQDYEAVVNFAKANGFTVTGTHPSRLLLEVNAPVANIEKAFRVTMNLYRHPKEARTFFASSTEPSVESGIPVLDVSGLNNYILPHRMNWKAAPLNRPGNAMPWGGSGSGGAYLGYDFRAAYAPNVSLTGSGQVVGLLELDGYYTNDIETYASLAGLPNVPLTNVLVNGFDGSPGANNSEVAMHIEMVISMAPGLSQVIVYEMYNDPDNFNINPLLNRMSEDTQVSQFSCSWGWNGNPNAETDQIFQKMALQGQSFFAASGDWGAWTGDVLAPSDNPYITVVGGTTLTTSGPGGSWVSETAWNWNNTPANLPFATGGGVSTVYSIPYWQQDLDMTNNSGSTTMRNLPDVSMTADNIFAVYGNGLTNTFGGTSAAAPLWAAFAALANEQAAIAGRPRVGFINPTLYAIGPRSDYLTDFHDIITGDNTNNGSLGFLAVPGYDLCTGWGTPAGQSLIDVLVGPLEPLGVTPVTGFAATGLIGGPFSITSQDYLLTNTGTASLNWSLIDTPLWLDASSSFGTLDPGASTTVTVSLNSTACNLLAGDYNATVWFTNLNSSIGQSRQFALQTKDSLVQNGGFETGDFSSWIQTGSTDYEFVSGSPYAHSGAYGALLGPQNALSYLSQTLPTIPGQTYLLSFWWESLDNGSGGGSNEFLVAWDGTTIFDQTEVGVFGWTNIQMAVTATENNTVLEFGFRNDPYYFALDDIIVTRLPTPEFQSVTLTNDAIAFTWSTVSSLTYQVQYTIDLTQTNWTNLGSSLTATDVTLSASDPIGLDPQRFYRVALIPP
jgi:hypothetical protein